ncbi:MAG: hypothetical protein FJ137_13465 [Deltaproteobacteria bacterium]|nr:hypothetical protein [Deltaproteobacteria bacterium]
MLAPLLAAALVAAPAAAASAAAVDDRLVLEAPNILGQQGLVRVTSARMAAPTLGVHTRLFFSPDFVLPDIADANTFAEGTVVTGFSAWDALEVALAARAGANLNAARAQPVASLGDLTLSLKGGHGFGLVAVAGDVRIGLPTRARRVGIDVANASAALDGIVSVDLLPLGVPVRVHGNAGYTLRGANRAVDAEAKYLLDGPDGALIAVATQSWFYDSAQVGLGVEAPLPFVTPFLETWFATAVGAPAYDVGRDAWLTVTPGVRLGVAGVRLDVAADLGLLGNAGGAVPQADAVFDGQPLNPLWALRVGVSHAFGAASAGSGDGAFARLEGCVTDVAGVLPGAVVSIDVDGRLGPRLLAGDDGCFAVPLLPGAARLSVVAVDHDEGAATAALAAGQTTRVDVLLSPRARQARLVGFATNKEDEVIAAQVVVIDAGGARAPQATEQGAFALTVRPGRMVVVARADGHLTQGIPVDIQDGERRALSFVMRKIPKRRSAQLLADRIETSARIPFEFKRARLQSAAEYLLDELADLLLTNESVKLAIEAHTDVSEVQDTAAATTLTAERAAAVRDALVARGVDGARLQTKGLGNSQPLAPGDPKNRRVELKIAP